MPVPRRVALKKVTEKLEADATGSGYREEPMYCGNPASLSCFFCAASLTIHSTPWLYRGSEAHPDSPARLTSAQRNKPRLRNVGDMEVLSSDRPRGSIP